MCGIFGLVAEPSCTLSKSELKGLLISVAKRSEARGKDSSGFVWRNPSAKKISVLKADLPLHKMLHTKAFKNLLQNASDQFDVSADIQVMGHARLVTNGSQLSCENNQPVCVGDLVAIHNGIIVNDEAIWQNHPLLQRKAQVDTEVILALIQASMSEGKTPIAAIQAAMLECTGTVSMALMINGNDSLYLFTNTGSFYFIEAQGVFLFASERDFLSEKEGWGTIKQLTAAHGIQLNLTSLKVHHFTLTNKVETKELDAACEKFDLEIDSIQNSNREEILFNISDFTKNQDRYRSLLQHPVEAVSKIKRCSRCVLPETFPFIEFDLQGVCNYCHGYHKKNQNHKPEDLRKLLFEHKGKAGKADCLVPFSGGRDSTYTMHYLCKELGLKPIAFTYDWGMVTDLARRNAARVCGKLGVENIIVAADIRLKRRNIQKNLYAWLKKPELGMIPLLMAGDKYFFYHSNRILKEYNLSLSVWGSNPLENTDFKSGFTGARPQFDKKRIDDLRLGDKLKVMSFFTKNYLGNPAYLNSSLFDTMGAFMSRYGISRQGYVQLFDYIKWDETTINDVIMHEYEWETSIDTSSTWRIGDGTAAFYNYVYYTVAGFTEHDTFRSNQIREGQLSRTDAMRMVTEENKPRFENLRWYLEVAGVDFKYAIEQINKIPKHYTI